MIGLPVCSLLVHKGINRVVHRRTLNQPVHDLKEAFPQVRRTLLGGGKNSECILREAFLAVKSLSESGKRLFMDMVEVNPILDERNKSAVPAFQLIQLTLGKAVC